MEKPKKEDSATQTEFAKLRLKQKKVTLFNAPVKALIILSLVALQALKQALQFVWRHVVPIVLSLALLAAFFFLPGPHEEVSNKNIVTVLVQKYDN